MLFCPVWFVQSVQSGSGGNPEAKWLCIYINPKQGYKSQYALQVQVHYFSSLIFLYSSLSDYGSLLNTLDIAVDVCVLSVVSDSLQPYGL